MRFFGAGTMTDMFCFFLYLFSDKLDKILKKSEKMSKICKIY